MIVVTPSLRCKERISWRKGTRTIASSAGQRLVEQQQAGRGGERARQRDALLLAARQLGRELRAAARQADQLQQLVDARASARAAPCG
jgi:hypothetical protein